MRDASETEIKLVASPAMLEALRDHADLAGPETVVRLNNAYFDTTDGSLAAAGASLRVRESSDGRMQTLKLEAAGGSAVRRNEWNVPLPGEALELSLFPATALGTLPALQGGADLEQVASSRVERTTRRVEFGNAKIEAAFDTGTIEAGGRSEEICELELELVEGRLSDVLALASRLPLGPELYWSLHSKSARSLRLAFEQAETTVHAEKLHFAKDCGICEGFRTIAWNCLGHFLGNYRSVVSSGAPAAVHQCRVAIRRFRAACSLFAELLEGDPATGLRAELKAVATQIGDLRDLDVLIVRVAKTADGPSGQDANELVSQLRERRSALAKPAQALLAGARLQMLLFALAGWIESGAWHTAPGNGLAGQPLSAFAASALARRRRKLRRKHLPVSDITVSDRHALRIDVKKLRYANEFFAGLFEGKAVAGERRRFAKALGRLQDSLGELNDLAVASTRSADLFDGVDPILAAKLEVELAGLLESSGKHTKKLLKTAEKSRSKLVDAPAWWKAGRTGDR